MGGKYRVAKTIDGKLEMFGYYETLEEATEVRDILVKNDWNVASIQDHLPHDRAIYRKYDKGKVVAYEIMKRIGVRWNILEATKL